MNSTIYKTLTIDGIIPNSGVYAEADGQQIFCDKVPYGTNPWVRWADPVVVKLPPDTENVMVRVRKLGILPFEQKATVRSDSDGLHITAINTRDNIVDGIEDDE